MNNAYFLRLLNSLQGFGPKTILNCLNRWPELEEMFAADQKTLLNFGLSIEAVQQVVRCSSKNFEEEELWVSSGARRKIITIVDEIYPSLLKEISSPPPVLFAEGHLDCLLSPKVAIVGSRKPTFGGQNIAFEFANHLAQEGIIILSGLARGIDASAHNGCIVGRGKTIAVMGTGVDSIYPKQHASLREKILENGLILSEFPLKTPPLAGHFPRRNRIISGLSLAVVVVESVIQSGSLLTARLALEQNREVMAVPGSIRNPQTAGCHYLLKQGAKLVTSIADVLEALSLETQFKESKKEAFFPKKSTREWLLQYMEENEVVSIDQLTVRCGQSVEDVIYHLMDLELEGVVRSLSGGYMRCTL